MTNKELNYLNSVKTQYSEKTISKVDSLKKLDRKVKRPVSIFAYVFGTISSLILGAGMCLAMGVIPQIGTLMGVGIPVGLVGIALCAFNYPLYKKLLKSRKEKYSEEILTLTDVLLNNEK